MYTAVPYLLQDSVFFPVYSPLFFRTGTTYARSAPTTSTTRSSGRGRRTSSRQRLNAIISGDLTFERALQLFYPFAGRPAAGLPTVTVFLRLQACNQQQRQGAPCLCLCSQWPMYGVRKDKHKRNTYSICTYSARDFRRPLPMPATPAPRAHMLDLACATPATPRPIPHVPTPHRRRRRQQRPPSLASPPLSFQKIGWA